MSGNGSVFASVIQEHLELKRCNSHLDDDLPLEEFVGEDPFRNHPLFKSESEARREEEETGEQPAIVEADTQPLPRIAAREPESWMQTSSAPDFNWD
jgi:hypothetical protein